jgi:hypothetical protein
VDGEAYSRCIVARQDAQWRVRTLADVVSDVVMRAAGARRKHRLAEEAWRRVALRQWQPVAHVQSVERGVVVVGVSDAARYEELRREGRHLGRELARLVPGVNGLRLVLAEVQEVHWGEFEVG